MSGQIIDDPASVFASLGGLHDVEISKILVDSVDQILEIDVEDINANFAELPEYAGLRPAHLRFIEATDILMDLNIWEGVRIASAKIAAESLGLRLEIYLNVGYGAVTGIQPKIIAKFRSLQIVDGSTVVRSA